MAYLDIYRLFLYIYGTSIPPPSVTAHVKLYDVILHGKLPKIGFNHIHQVIQQRQFIIHGFGLALGS